MTVSRSSAFSVLGQVRVDGDLALLIFERRYPHPVEKVWRAITDSSELSKWYFSRGCIEPRLGGRVDFYLGPAHVTGSVLVWDPPHVFEHEWIFDRPNAPEDEASMIRWELKSAGKETILRLTHTKLPATAARNFAVGVHVRLDRLDSFLDGHPLPFWKDHLASVQSRYLGD